MLIELRDISNGPAMPGAVIVSGDFPIDDGVVDLTNVTFPTNMDYLGIYVDSRYAGMVHIGPAGIVPPTEEELAMRSLFYPHPAAFRF